MSRKLEGARDARDAEIFARLRRERAAETVTLEMLRERLRVTREALGALVEHNDLVDEWNEVDPESTRGKEIEQALFGTPCFQSATGTKCPVRLAAKAALRETETEGAS